jgi:hypothetical protein
MVTRPSPARKWNTTVSNIVHSITQRIGYVKHNIINLSSMLQSGAPRARASRRYPTRNYQGKGLTHHIYHLL